MTRPLLSYSERDSSFSFFAPQAKRANNNNNQSQCEWIGWLEGRLPLILVEEFTKVEEMWPRRVRRVARIPFPPFPRRCG